MSFENLSTSTATHSPALEHAGIVANCSPYVPVCPSCGTPIKVTRRVYERQDCPCGNLDFYPIPQSAYEAEQLREMAK